MAELARFLDRDYVLRVFDRALMSSSVANPRDHSIFASPMACRKEIYSLITEVELCLPSELVIGEPFILKMDYRLQDIIANAIYSEAPNLGPNH